MLAKILSIDPNKVKTTVFTAKQGDQASIKGPNIGLLRCAVSSRTNGLAKSVAKYLHAKPGMFTANTGMFQMIDQLPYERLSIGLGAVASAERAVELTSQYVKDRKVFGKPLLELQNTRFKMAECKTEAHIGRLFINDCIKQFIEGRLDGVTAAMAKYWLTETQCRIIDTCLQLHGGYGYMHEYPIARMWADSRVQKIYAGSNEVMKEVVGWSI